MVLHDFNYSSNKKLLQSNSFEDLPQRMLAKTKDSNMTFEYFTKFETAFIVSKLKKRLVPINSLLCFKDKFDNYCSTLNIILYKTKIRKLDNHFAK